MFLRYFLIIDPAMYSIEVIENPSTDAEQSAGVRAAQLVCNKNVGVDLTGHCGPKAKKTLESSNIKVIMDFMGTVLHALSKYKNRMEQ